MSRASYIETRTGLLRRARPRAAAAFAAVALAACGGGGSATDEALEHTAKADITQTRAMSEHVPSESPKPLHPEALACMSDANARNGRAALDRAGREEHARLASASRPAREAPLCAPTDAPESSPHRTDTDRREAKARDKPHPTHSGDDRRPQEPTANPALQDTQDKLEDEPGE